MAEKKDEEKEKEIIESLRKLAENEDFAYTLRDYAFRLMGLHNVDQDLYEEERMSFLYFLKSAGVDQKVIEEVAGLSWRELRSVLVSIIPYLNIKAQQGGE